MIVGGFSKGLFSFAGIAAGLYGKLVGASDYQLNLHPPEEDTQDVLDSLDSVMAVSVRCDRVSGFGWELECGSVVLLI